MVGAERRHGTLRARMVSQGSGSGSVGATIAPAGAAGKGVEFIPPSCDHPRRCGSRSCEKDDDISTQRCGSRASTSKGSGIACPFRWRAGSATSLATSAISGRDAKTGKLAPDADGQARLAFENLKAILAKGGMGLGDVVKIGVYLADESHREAIAKYWLECYPDAAKRPARHAITLPLRGGVLLQIDALAVSQG